MRILALIVALSFVVVTTTPSASVAATPNVSKSGKIKSKADFVKRK